MRDPPAAWGKLRRDPTDGRTVAFLPLADHAADVAAVFRALATTPATRDRWQGLAGEDQSEDLLAAMVGAAYLHDIGKANVGFWRKHLPPERRRGQVAGHTAEVAPLLFGRYRKPGLLARESPYFAPGSPAADLLIAALGHHGTPLARDDLVTLGANRQFDHLWRTEHEYDPLAEARHLLASLAIVLPDSPRAAANLSAVPPFVLHLLLGLLSLADWIASDARSGFFPFEEATGEARFAFATRRAAEVAARMGLDARPARAALSRSDRRFEEVFGEPAHPFAPTEVQAAMARTDLGRIVVLEAPTGSGKTEAALWRFRTLFAAGAVDSLAFLLPTRTSAVLLEARVRRAIERLWPEAEARPNVVLAVPGYLRADGAEGWREHGFEVEWPDDPHAALAHRRWAAESPKRGLAAMVVVATVDQALLAALRVRHAHLRGACLLRSLLVVDEVHASDTWMTELLRVLLERHLAAGGHALLLSATLGESARARLLDPRGAARPKPRPLCETETLPYPLISDERGNRLAPAAGSVAKRVAITLLSALDEPAKIAARALAAACAGARVLVVRNTVSGAVAVQRAIEDLAPDGTLLFRVATVAAPHHGRFAAPDRRLLDAAVEASFGKHAERAGGLVLVGTQTLEQSLDIDADVLITDLCPMDVLLQRLGRLHRHASRHRPAGCEEPRAIVLMPEGRDLTPLLKGGRGRAGPHGLGSVYDNLLVIEATWRLLEARPILTLPDDNRVLVEHATHPEALERIARACGAAWETHWQTLVGTGAVQRQLAGTVALDWAEDLLGQRFAPLVEEALRTRLGVDDRRFRLDRPLRSVFGSQVDEIVVPGHLARGIAEEVEVARVVADGDEAVLIIDNARFRYGRFGLVREREGTA